MKQSGHGSMPVSSRCCPSKSTRAEAWILWAAFREDKIYVVGGRRYSLYDCRDNRMKYKASSRLIAGYRAWVNPTLMSPLHTLHTTIFVYLFATFL